MNTFKKKNCLGFIYSSQTAVEFKNNLSNNFIHIKNISSCFKEIYILDLNKFQLFAKKKNNYKKIFRDLNFNKKVKFYNPKNTSELNIFLKNKSFHGVVNLRKKISHLPIYFLLKKHNIKLFDISNVGNVQTSHTIIDKNFLKSFLYIYREKFKHKFFILLKVIGIIPKIEIRFMSNKFYVDLFKKKKSIYNKLIKFFNISYAKKLIVINSRAYDLFCNNRFIKNEKYIILLDDPINEPQYAKLRGGHINKVKFKIHYENMIKRLKIISKYYKKKVVVCLHPSCDFEFKKKIFSDFMVKQHETKKYIYQSKLVLFFESSAIIDAIMLKKKIMTIFSNAQDQNQIAKNMHYVNEVKIPFLNIDDDLIFDKNTKNKFKYNKKKIKATYDSYIKKFVAADNSKILGYIKFSNIIKKNYFRI